MHVSAISLRWRDWKHGVSGDTGEMQNKRCLRLFGGISLPGLLLILFPVLSARLQAIEQNSQPDVLFIVVDDLNDWISLLDEESPVRTPNLKRLAARGTLFTQAYCVSAACNPSRAAVMTGLRPSTTGVYGNRSDWRHAVPDRLTIMERFRRAGYLVTGAGKIFHHHLNGAFHDDRSFERFQQMRPQLYPPAKLNRAPAYGSRNTDWGVWPPDEEDAIDSVTLKFCSDALTAPRDRPLFVACGLFKPHSPFFAPAEYHRATEHILPPPRNADDWLDLPTGARTLMKNKDWFWRGMMKLDRLQPGSWRRFVRAYAACVRFADTQVGRLLDALDESPGARKTIIVLWSDHGFHLGEKDHIEKFALWEKSNHIPLIVVAPEVSTPGTRCDQPVDLTAVYPTLLELAGLRADSTCDGRSLVPLLKQPKQEWDQPAVMTYQRGNHAVRSKRWRYIRYADGSEELYYHKDDPHEWRNLATLPLSEGIMAAHRRWLPQNEAPQVKDLRRQE